jgi:hypothetical protein
MLMAWSRLADPEVSDSTAKLLKHCGRDGSRLVPTTLAAWKIVTPGTVIRWHRLGFRAYWRLRSRGGGPQIPEDVR